MKKMLFVLSLFAMSVPAKAGLVIFNDTDCPIEYEIKAHDPNHALCTLESVIISLGAWSSVSFGNLTDVNPNPPYGWLGPYSAPSGLPPAVWAWDAIKYNSTGGGTWGGQIGNPSICSNVATQTFINACTGITVYAEWMAVGTNVIVSFHY